MVAGSAITASLTAVHLAIAAYRRHRAGGASLLNPFVLPSFLFAGTPWLWASPVSQGLLVLAHLAWVALCEVVAPASTRAMPRSSVATPPRASAAGPAAPRRPPAPRPKASGEGFEPITVLAVLDEASDIRTFRLARSHGLEFTAGQFLPVRVSIGGKPHVRCYSISSSPESRGYVEISVRSQGLVSTTLHTTLRTGSQLAVGRPAGQFVYPAGDDRPLVLLAGGIGVTPLLSMLRYGVSSDPTRPITLLYSARDRQAMAFLPELRVIAARHPQIRIAVTVSEPGAPAPWRTGRIDLPLIRQYVTHPAHTIFCVCGPTAMMAAMTDLLVGEGVPREQIRSEQFDTSAAATLLNPSAAAPAPGVAPTGAEYQVTFAGSDRTIRVPSSLTLLEAAESEGIEMISSCRSGVCQACRVRLAEGDVDCRSSVLDAEERAAGFILPCVTWAQGDCVVEA